jgi:hypothetical protein
LAPPGSTLGPTGVSDKNSNPNGVSSHIPLLFFLAFFFQTTTFLTR